MKIYSKKFIWHRSKAKKLIHMKRVGHRGYKAISKAIGCSVASAQEKYLKIC